MLAAVILGTMYACSGSNDKPTAEEKIIGHKELPVAVVSNNQTTTQPEVTLQTDTDVPPAKGMTRFSSDYGCNSYETQVSRLAVMKIIFEAATIRNRGLETEETKQAGEIATRKMVELSKSNCQELHGDYKIVNRRRIAGGEAVQVQFNEKTRLWVLGE